MSIPPEAQEAPYDSWIKHFEQEKIRFAQINSRRGGTISPQPFRPREIVPPTDALGRLATDHPEILNLVAESLIARGALASLAALNTASYPLYAASLPLLWRTFVWDAYGKGKTKTDEYWKRFVGSEGAEHIRTGTLKAYVAEFDDLRAHFVKHNERKVVVHLLPAYEPVGFGAGGDQDLITVRHALVHLSPPPGDKRPKKKTGSPCNATSVGYAFYIIHPSPSQPTSPLPTWIDGYAARRPLPVLPVTLDAVLLAPSSKAFTEEDKPRLSHITFEFLASMDHEPRVEGVEWNGYIGAFTTQRILEEEKCRSYVEYHWQDGVESMIICAQAAADALAPFSQSKTFNWIELQFSSHTNFPHDNTAIHTILEALQVPYLLHAPRRLHPPDHNMGDVVIQDMSRDLLAALKRVVPGRRVVAAGCLQTESKGERSGGKGQGEEAQVDGAAAAEGVKPELFDQGKEMDGGKGEENDKEDVVEEETRNVVEYFIKRYAAGEGWKLNTQQTFHDSHDPERVVFYKEFPM
ncbi:hypothetical protein QFC21_003894 [Naganishia friedmannii]|uniref:Uncharacterized protein n=1 Tax=Naganishia friedmannii TaxID=89922 RepID=A0ACC2VL70_9TREE|nr:hypothetical protein QFC21_003894 [Naganishia friedmannii]